jgi:putative holliday junction resolvase
MIICLDYGERYVGVAATDRDESITLRHSVIDQKEESDVLSAIEELVKKDEVSKVVVGVPIGMSGEETAQTQETLDFIGELKLKLGDEMEVEGIDERLTSIQAGQNIQAEGGKKEDEHMEAARLILESYLAKQQ